MNIAAEVEKKSKDVTTESVPEPGTFSAEAYISAAYARAERDKLWRKVWQQVGRVEEIPEVGSFITYDILDDSILIVRAAPDTLRAYYNVCSHRGRRLVDMPSGAMKACGKQSGFVCGFHAWRYNLEGQCIHIAEKKDWQGVLTEERTRLGEVKVDTWGGWIWINMDPNASRCATISSPLPRCSIPFSSSRCATSGASG